MRQSDDFRAAYVRREFVYDADAEVTFGYVKFHLPIGKPLRTGVTRKTGIYSFAGNCRITPENTKNIAIMHAKSSRGVEGYR